MRGLTSKLATLTLLMLSCSSDEIDRRPSSDRALRTFGEPIQGVTLSTHRGGQDWASDQIGATLTEIRSTGANWIAIHPYAGIQEDGGIRFRDSGSTPQFLRRPVEEAHTQGLKVLLKPHLAYWRSSFKWRGDIRFEGPESWKRFFEDYSRWIQYLIEAVPDADGLILATELDATLDHEREWRRILREVRAIYHGPVSYAANWTDYQRVPFWDDLDAVGIQAYFPVADADNISEKAIRANWGGLMTRLRNFSEEVRRPIIFTELGYNRSYEAPVRPWDHRTDDEGASAIQQASLRLALEAVRKEASVLGSFLWKWFPQPRTVGRDFQLASPGMKNVVQESWLERIEPNE